MKKLYNDTHAGFSLSAEVVEEHYKRCPCEAAKYRWDDERDCPVLIKIVEEFGCDRASDRYSRIKVAEFEDRFRGFLVEDDDMCGSPYVDIPRFRLHLIHSVLERNSQPEEAIRRIKKILSEAI